MDLVLILLIADGIFLLVMLLFLQRAGMTCKFFFFLIYATGIGIYYLHAFAWYPMLMYILPVITVLFFVYCWRKDHEFYYILKKYFKRKMSLIDKLVDRLGEDFDFSTDTKVAIGEITAKNTSPKIIYEFLDRISEEAYPFDVPPLFIYQAYFEFGDEFSPYDFIFVNAGALKRKQDQEAFILVPPSVMFLKPDVLTFVLGHEFGHHYYGHTILSFWDGFWGKFFKSFSIGFIGVMFGGIGLIAGLTMVELIGESLYSKEQEYEADEIGAMALQLNGYGKSGAMRLFRYFEETKLYDNDIINDISNLLFGSHPSEENRMEHLNNYNIN